MTLSVLSKLGLIVGVVAGLASSLFLADDSWNNGYATLPVGASLLTAILSGLLIWGILKKHCVLVATWLAAAFPLAGYAIVHQIDRAIRWHGRSWSDYKDYVLITGAQTIVLYAIFQLFLELCRDRAAVVKYFEPTKHTGKSEECAALRTKHSSKMTLSVLSKLGLIIGVVAGLASALFMADEINYLKRTLEGEDYRWNEGYALKAALPVGAGLLTAILSGLLIWGILKKHCVLVATWLAAAFLIAGYVIGDQMDRAIRGNRRSLSDYISYVLLAGGQTIVLYAIFQLFLELCPERAAVVKYFEPTKHTGKSAKYV